MRRRRSSSPVIPFLLFLVVICGGLGSLIFGYIYLVNTVKQIYGDPAVGLDQLTLLPYQFQLFLNRDQLTQPANSADQTRTFEIELGESVNSIAYRLEVAGFIPDSASFRAYLIYSGMDTQLQAGEYQLTAAMTPLELSRKLLDATPTEVTFQILAGWRLEEIAAALPTSGLSFTPEEFLAAVQNPDASIPTYQYLPAGASLEGFLYPDSYRLKRDITLDAFLQTISQNFEIKVTQDMRDAYAKRGLTLDQAVTLASIVEREAVVAEEQPIIASVFYNRIAAGMRLDSDPTVQYALGFNETQNTWWTNPFSTEDFSVESPYNTYQVTGLPPGPISNPSLTALQAVAYPADTPYYYFRAKCDGSGKHEFAETYDEHVQNACTTTTP